MRHSGATFRGRKGRDFAGHEPLLAAGMRLKQRLSTPYQHASLVTLGEIDAYERAALRPHVAARDTDENLLRHVLGQIDVERAALQPQIAGGGRWRTSTRVSGPRRSH